MLNVLDHCRRALCAAIDNPSPSWRSPRGRPRHTWTRKVESDLHWTTVGRHTAWRRVQDRSAWRTLVETATLQRGHANDDGDDESSLWPDTRQSQRVPAAARLRRMYKLKSQAAPIRDSK